MNNKIGRYLVVLVCLLGLTMPLQAAPDPSSGGADDVVVNAFLRDQIRSVIDQVRAYRSALKSLTQDAKRGVQAKAAEMKIEAFVRRAEKLALDNRLKEALGAAEEANRLTVESIVQMRSGETVVVSLSFDTPEQEFAYEKRRFESNEVMVAMARDDARSAGANTRGNIEALLTDARRQRDLGEREASAGKYAEAVPLLEGANRQMTRVLQELGVPVF